MLGQPADSMVDDKTINDMIPSHIPVDMAVAPEHDTLSRHHVVKAPSTSTPNKRYHTLSPEKLGVVGYVKDVAGFVTDYVQDTRERRRHSRDSASPERQRTVAEPTFSPSENDTVRERRSSTQEVAEEEAARKPRSPLAHVVGQLFPGIHPAEQEHPCIHADEIRSEMMRTQDTLRDGERSIVPKR